MLHYYVWKSANYGTETVWNAMVEINKKNPDIFGIVQTDNIRISYGKLKLRLNRNNMPKGKP